MIPLLMFIAFVLLICIALWVARKYGAVNAYIGFAWLIPLTGIIWWKGEYSLGFGMSELNVPFVMTITVVSLFALFCFAVLATKYWRSLSPLKRIGLVVSAFLHGIPFLMYFFLSIFPPM